MAEMSEENRTLKRELAISKEVKRGPIQLPIGFVPHSMFLCFIKGARWEMEKRNDVVENFKQAVSLLMNALEERNDKLFLSQSKADLDTPQSLVAAELLSMALHVAKTIL